MTRPSAEVICDSISPNGHRITTMVVVMHRFILAEFNTHRKLSKNSASSRAIPIARQLDRVKGDPAMPVRWGLNGRGMQDHGEMSDAGRREAEAIWLDARDDAVMQVERLLELREVPHKQITNRLLEPFMWHRAVVTSTEWENFFRQRNHRNAQPEIKALAVPMYEALVTHEPTPLKHGEWHLPFIKSWERGDYNTQALLRMSSARCARVSYDNLDGTKNSFEADMDTFGKLALRTYYSPEVDDWIVSSDDPEHWSPLEHQATPDTYNDEKWGNPEKWGNLDGWIQHRHCAVGNTIPDAGADMPYNYRSLNMDGVGNLTAAASSR